MKNDLISKAEVIRVIDEYGYVNCYNGKDFEANNRVDKIRQKIGEMSTTFDLESMIEQVKEKGTKVCCSVKCNDDCKNCEHGILMKSILEVLKSTENATNGKIRG